MVGCCDEYYWMFCEFDCVCVQFFWCVVYYCEIDFMCCEYVDDVVVVVDFEICFYVWMCCGEFDEQWWDQVFGCCDCVDLQCVVEIVCQCGYFVVGFVLQMQDFVCVVCYDFVGCGQLYVMFYLLQ